MSRKQGEARTDPRWRGHVEPAPGDLRIVQALINTGVGGEQLPTPRALADWLAHWGLASADVETDPGDLEQIHTLRTDLRALVAAQLGGPLEAGVVERFDRTLRDATLRPRVASDGSVRLEPVESGLASALASLFFIVAMAHRDGTDRDGEWHRLKLCARDDCGAAFYDFSRGLFGTWCSRRCGNRGTSRTYRQRRKRHREQARRQRARSARA